MLMVTGIPAIDPQHHSHADRFIPPADRFRLGVRDGMTPGGSPSTRRHIRRSSSEGSFRCKIPGDATAVTHDVVMR